ncbi:MAG: hypothetical protein H6698_00060 [Myxococcales bacterium]|nr:hypothetical protein [Myxococcales bacterium]MCB9520561.1 hypothetical protein [Myxococcales bacterium]MCB9532705.1 hypothetical protein [Myxococcales bacterium]
MQMGFNNDIEYKQLTVHIQTEDHGLGSKKITSQVFFSGAILDSRTISYANEIAAIEDDAARDERIRLLMKAIHKKFYKKIHDGDYDEKLPIGAPPTPAAPHLSVRSSDSEVGLNVPAEVLAQEGFAIAGEQAALGEAYDAGSRGERLDMRGDSVPSGLGAVVDEIAAAASGMGAAGFVQLGGVGTGAHPVAVPAARRPTGRSPAMHKTPAFRGYDPAVDAGFAAVLLEGLEAP